MIVRNAVGPLTLTLTSAPPAPAMLVLLLLLLLAMLVTNVAVRDGAVSVVDIPRDGMSSVVGVCVCHRQMEKMKGHKTEIESEIER